MSPIPSPDRLTGLPIDTVVIPSKQEVPVGTTKIAPGRERIVYHTVDPQVVVAFPQVGGHIDSSEGGRNKLGRIGRKQNYLADLFHRVGGGFMMYDTVDARDGVRKISHDVVIPKIQYSGPQGEQYIQAARGFSLIDKDFLVLPTSAKAAALLGYFSFLDALHRNDLVMNDHKADSIFVDYDFDSHVAAVDIVDVDKVRQATDTTNPWREEIDNMTEFGNLIATFFSGQYGRWSGYRDKEARELLLIPEVVRTEILETMRLDPNHWINVLQKCLVSKKDLNNADYAKLQLYATQP